MTLFSLIFTLSNRRREKKIYVTKKSRKFYWYLKVTKTTASDRELVMIIMTMFWRYGKKILQGITNWDDPWTS